MRVWADQVDVEPRTQVVGGNQLATYTLTCEIWTAQGMPASSGDQMTDQGTICRALEAILNEITPNTAWFFVPGFLHCLKRSGSVVKAPDLFQGADVYVSTNEWSILVTE